MLPFIGFAAGISIRFTAATLIARTGSQTGGYSALYVCLSLGEDTCQTIKLVSDASALRENADVLGLRGFLYFSCFLI